MFSSSFWKVFCTGEDSGQRRPIIRIKRSPLEKPQASQNQVTRVFSFVLILSTPPPEKKVDQNVVLCKDIGVNITQIENIEVIRVCIICYQVTVFVQGVLVCFLKVFRFMLSRITLSATNNKQHLTQKQIRWECTFCKVLVVGLIQLSWDQIDLLVQVVPTAIPVGVLYNIHTCVYFNLN